MSAIDSSGSQATEAPAPAPPPGPEAPVSDASAATSTETAPATDSGDSIGAGASGPEVQVVHASLKAADPNADFGDEETKAVYGPKTQAAVENLQHNNGLPTTGRFDGQTADLVSNLITQNQELASTRDPALEGVNVHDSVESQNLAARVKARMAQGEAGTTTKPTPAATEKPVPDYKTQFGNARYVKNGNDPKMRGNIGRVVADAPELKDTPLAKNLREGKPLTPENIKTYQRHLQSKGNSVGRHGVDGKYGPDTHGATQTRVKAQTAAKAAAAQKAAEDAAKNKATKQADKPAATPAKPHAPGKVDGTDKADAARLAKVQECVDNLKEVDAQLAARDAELDSTIQTHEEAIAGGSTDPDHQTVIGNAQALKARIAEQRTAINEDLKTATTENGEPNPDVQPENLNQAVDRHIQAYGEIEKDALALSDRSGDVTAAGAVDTTPSPDEQRRAEFKTLVGLHDEVTTMQESVRAKMLGASGDTKAGYEKIVNNLAVERQRLAKDILSVSDGKGNPNEGTTPEGIKQVVDDAQRRVDALKPQVAGVDAAEAAAQGTEAERKAEFQRLVDKYGRADRLYEVARNASNTSNSPRQQPIWEKETAGFKEAQGKIADLILKVSDGKGNPKPGVTLADLERANGEAHVLLETVKAGSAGALGNAGMRASNARNQATDNIKAAEQVRKIAKKGVVAVVNLATLGTGGDIAEVLINTADDVIGRQWIEQGVQPTLEGLGIALTANGYKQMIDMAASAAMKQGVDNPALREFTKMFGVSDAKAILANGIHRAMVENRTMVPTNEQLMAALKTEYDNKVKELGSRYSGGDFWTNQNKVNFLTNAAMTGVNTVAKRKPDA